MNYSNKIINNKYLLYHILLEKVFLIINLYNNLHRKIIEGTLVERDIHEDEDWKTCWQSCIELYDYIEFQYIDEMLKQKFVGINYDKESRKDYSDNFIKEKKLLEEIIINYKNGNKILTFKELTILYNDLRYVTTKIGLHSIEMNDNRKNSYLDYFEEPEETSWEGME